MDYDNTDFLVTKTFFKSTNAYCGQLLEGVVIFYFTCKLLVVLLERLNKKSQLELKKKIMQGE